METQNMCARLGLWKKTSPGYFGGGQEWAYPTLGMNPNPTECVWLGPNVSDIECSTCALGYETTSASNSTCIQPEFRPHSGWQGSSEQAELQLKGIDNTDTGTPMLLTKHKYTIPAPKLEPKERKFAGYAQPFLKIRYELDFSRGAEVNKSGKIKPSGG